MDSRITGSLYSKGKGHAENLSNLDFEYFEAEIDKYRHGTQDNMMVYEDEEPNQQTLKEKLSDMDRDFRKVLEICQAMLVYSKDKHFHTIALEEQVNVLRIHQ